MKKWFKIVLLIISIDVSGQNYPHDLPEYDFIDLNYNFIFTIISIKT